MLQICYINSVQLIYFLLFTVESELVVLVQGFQCSIFEVLNFEGILLIDWHFAEEFTAFFIAHIRIVIEVMLIRHLAVLFISRNNCSQTNISKPFIEISKNISIFNKTKQMPCNSSILTAYQISFCECSEHIWRYIIHVSNRSGNYCEFSSRWRRIQDSCCLAKREKARNFMVNLIILNIQLQSLSSKIALKQPKNTYPKIQEQKKVTNSSIMATFLLNEVLAGNINSQSDHPYLYIFAMDPIAKGDEWVADENQLGETRQQLPVLEQQEEQIEEEEPLSPSKDRPISLSEPVLSQQTQIAEVTCIEDINLVLTLLVGRKLELSGRLRVTNQKLTFFTATKHETEEIFFQIPIGFLQKCQRIIEDKFTSIEVFIKYGCTFKFRFPEGKYEFSLKTHQIISELVKGSVKLAVQWGSLSPKTSLCQSLVPLSSGNESYEFQNDGWKRYPNYPQRFMVPLKYLAKNVPEERLVVFSFKYKNGKEEVGVWRIGPGKADPAEQEWIVKSRMPSSKSYTIDIKNKGIGSNKSSACRVVEVEGLPFIRQSFANLYRITFNNHQALKWLSNLNQTRWLEQIAFLLQQASALVNRVTSQSSAMITILADTDVRAAQISAIAQVLLFPECRTLKGFADLMQRELLQWGYSRIKRQEGDKGAAIIQFLDAIYQLTCIYPLSFQFSNNTLVFLAENVYSNRFGNFLLASRAIKEEQQQIVSKCCSVWQWLQARGEDGWLIYNPFYVDFKECDIYELKQLPSCRHLRLWSGFFLKKLRQTNQDYLITARYQQIHLQHYMNKMETDTLRKQLSEQHKVLVERRNILKELKALQ